MTPDFPSLLSFHLLPWTVQTPKSVPTKTLRKTLLFFFLQSFCQTCCLSLSHCTSPSILSSPLPYSRATGGKTKCMCRCKVCDQSSLPFVIPYFTGSIHHLAQTHPNNRKMLIHPSTFTSNFTFSCLQTSSLLLQVSTLFTIFSLFWLCHKRLIPKERSPSMRLSFTTE